MKNNGLHTTDAQVEKAIEIPPLGLAWLQVEVRGIQPLIVHRFSEKARKQIADKQQKKAKPKKDARDPMEEARAALYVLPKEKGEERYGFPAAGIKKAIVSACRQVDGLAMTFAKGALHVYGDGQGSDGRDLIRLYTPGWTMREDVVRLDDGGTSLAYRPEFKEWSMKLRIRYLASSIHPAQIIHLLNVAGFAVGLGENRAEKSGDTWGQFEVVTEGGN